MLRGILIEIKEIFKYSSARQDFINLPQYLREYKTLSNDKNEKANHEIEELSRKCDELKSWKLKQEGSSNALFLKCQDKEKTISELKLQI